MAKTKQICSYKSIIAFSLILLVCTPALALTPDIHSITPDYGGTNSPTYVTIAGNNFESTTKVALHEGEPYIKGSVPTDPHCYCPFVDVHVSDRYAYVAVRGTIFGFEIIDISDPTNPTIVSYLETG